MSPTFWRAIDALGSAPAAALTWRKFLGGEEADARPFLRRTRNHASVVIDPDEPQHWLDVYPDDENDLVALCDDRPPLPLKAEDVFETSRTSKLFVRRWQRRSRLFLPPRRPQRHR